MLGVAFFSGLTVATTNIPQSQPTPELVRAERIEIVDADGNPRIVLGTTKHGGTAVFLAERGHPTHTLAVDDQGNGWISTLDSDQNILTELGANADGGAIQVRGSDGEPRISMFTNNFGEGVLITAAGKDKLLVRLDATERKGGMIQVFNGKGDIVINAGAARDDGGRIRVHDSMLQLSGELGR